MNYRPGQRVRAITSFDLPWREFGTIKVVNAHEASIDFDGDPYSTENHRWRHPAEIELVEDVPEPVDECAEFFS